MMKAALRSALLVDCKAARALHAMTMLRDCSSMLHPWQPVARPQLPPFSSFEVACVLVFGHKDVQAVAFCRGSYAPLWQAGLV